MTDAEIIKALECCRMPAGSGACNDCPFDYQREKRLAASDKSCTTLMFDCAITLITRQQSQIEVLSQKRANIFEISSAYERGRSEAIKEAFARLRKRVSGVGVHNAIDCIEKEMVCEDK